MHPTDQSWPMKMESSGLAGLCRETLFGKKKNRNNQLTIQGIDRSNKRCRPHKDQLGWEKDDHRDTNRTVALSGLRATSADPSPLDG